MDASDMDTSKQRAAASPLASHATGSPGARGRRTGAGHGSVVAVVALGGALGTAGRYGALRIWPVPESGFPWTVLGVNAVGCVLIGVFMVVITEVWAAHRLVRPFVGTGVLGGFTTFSTYAVGVAHLLRHGHAATGLAYLVVTVVVAMVAVWGGATLTRRGVGGRSDTVLGRRP